MIYFIQDIHAAGPIKIGYAVDPEQRCNALQTGAFAQLVVRAVCEGNVKDERRLHVRFAAHRIRGEWYAPAPELTAFIEGMLFAQRREQPYPPDPLVLPVRGKAATPTEAELRGALTQYRGNVTAVARAFGRERMQIHRWLQRYGIDLEVYR